MDGRWGWSIGWTAELTFRMLLAGSTPLGCYQKLIEYYENGDLSFKYVKTFNMDEYVGEWPSCSSWL